MRHPLYQIVIADLLLICIKYCQHRP